MAYMPALGINTSGKDPTRKDPEEGREATAPSK
jgi:hypothetical protein